MITLNNQMLLEKTVDYSSGETTYQTKLYDYTSNIIEQEQKEKDSNFDRCPRRSWKRILNATIKGRC